MSGLILQERKQRKLTPLPEPKKPVYFSRHDIERSLCKDSFFDFVKIMWSSIVTEPAVWNWHIEFMCNEIQEAAERVFRMEKKKYDIICNVPPGTTKSTVFSVMFPAWAFSKKPTSQIICASHTHELVLDLSRKCREVVRSAKYQELFPHVRLQEDQDAKGLWATTEKGWRLAATVGGKNPTGFHGHFLIIDDPIDPQQIMSDLKIKAANDFMKDTLSQRKVSRDYTLTMLVMQRLHQNDPAGNWLEREPDSIKRFVLPAEDSYEVFPKELAKRYVDGMLDPVRLPRHVLAVEKKRGQFFYSGQFGQNPVPLGGGMFKTARIIIDEAPPKEFIRMVRAWDKAGTKGGGNFTAGVKMGLQDLGGGKKRIWVLDMVRGQFGTDEREEIIVSTAKLDGIGCQVVLAQDPGQAGIGDVEATIQRLVGFLCRVVKPTGDKALRADPFSVQVNQRNVYMYKADWNAEYISEMRYFPMSTYDDQIDASSDAFLVLSEPLLEIGAF